MEGNEKSGALVPTNGIASANEVDGFKITVGIIIWKATNAPITALFNHGCLNLFADEGGDDNDDDDDDDDNNNNGKFLFEIIFLFIIVIIIFLTW